MKPWHHGLRWMTGLLLVGAVCWISGLLWFVEITRQAEPVLPPHTDGIVALTGGAGRVDLALHLLADGQADKLLLSGIGGGTDLATLSRLAGVEVAPFADRVTLGRYAASTRGNAVETAAWAQQNRVRSLIVVTAAYHMPRALAELRQALPGVRLFPWPVTHPVAEAGLAAERAPGWRLESEEYTKYLLSASGLSGWLPQRESGAVQGSPTGPMLPVGPDGPSDGGG